MRRLAARVGLALGSLVLTLAAVELVFAPQHDPAAKLARIQFPGAPD